MVGSPDGKFINILVRFGSTCAEALVKPYIKQVRVLGDCEAIGGKLTGQSLQCTGCRMYGFCCTSSQP